MSTVESESSGAPVDAQAWRRLLAQRLTALTSVLSGLAVVPIAFGTTGATRGILGGIAAAMAVVAGALARRQASPHAGMVLLVTLFVVAGTAGMARLGLLAAPGACFTLALVLAGVLAGRRALLVVTGVIVVVLALVGGALARGALPSPPLDDFAPWIALTWVRGGAVFVFIAFITGAAVTWTVEQVEAAMARAAALETRRREAEQMAAAAQKTELVGTMAAGLAHDVNNQLTVVAMWNQLLAETTSEAERADGTSAITGAVAQASALIRQLLVLGRRDVRAPRALGLARVLAGIEPTVRKLLPADVVLTMDADPTAAIVVDEAQLQQMILNLVINARDAMPRGGTLTVRAARDPARTVGGRPAVVVVVADDGEGMDEETRARALDPFFTTKDHTAGSGLGLPTVAAMVQASEGDLTLASARGSGTTVTLAFPAVAVPPPVEEETERARTASIEGLRVLLADDGAELLAAAARVLRGAGCLVTEARDGDDALGKARVTAYDVLCTDVVMPGAPVRDVIDAFERANPGAAVLLCSGYVAEDLVRRGIEEGRFELLAKPFAPAALRDRVRALAKRRSSSSSTAAAGPSV